MGTGSFPGVKSGRDMTLTPYPLLVPWSKVELYLYSPYGLYGLYRASVPVQWRTLPYLPYPTMRHDIPKAFPEEISYIHIIFYIHDSDNNITLYKGQ